MDKCLQCQDNAIPSAMIHGVQIYECSNGHRTGILKGVKAPKRVKQKKVINQDLTIIAFIPEVTIQTSKVANF